MMNIYPSEVKDKELIDTIRRMAFIAEYREPDAVNHRERVRGYVKILARCIGLSPQEVEIISFASLLHDVGKVGLPDSLSSRSDNLTPYEWEQMTKHTTIGASLLEGSPSVMIQVSETIALTHHERWDGSGYPNGLVGDQIPLSGRLCAIADVFDALTTRRSYKKEVSVEEAANLIREASGQLFDPQLVHAFTDSLDSLLKIRSLGLTKPVYDF